MFKILFSLSLALTNFSSFAEQHDSSEVIQGADDEQRAFLCLEVTKMLIEEQADMAIDFMGCLHNREIHIEVVGAGVKAIKGPLKTYAPSRPPFELNCTVYSEEYLIKMADTLVECDA